MLLMRISLLLYRFFISAYALGIRIAALWNPKAKEWLAGRKNLFTALEKEVSKDDRIIWFHCASAGELEQGKPVIEALKLAYPSHKILVSFFSPSGYSVAKKYRQADVITYLPLDTRGNAARFIRTIRPELVVFIKYEYWYYHLSAVAFHHIPLLLVSGIFRKDQVFFKRYGGFHRQMLFLFRHLFVQDTTSYDLLKGSSIHHCTISGDTRFDRVNMIASGFSALPLIQSFAGNEKLLVAGSTWPEDEQLIADYCKQSGIKCIVAPHEITTSHLSQLEKLFPGSVRYSQLEKEGSSHAKVLVIDNIGMLSRLYHYADVCYVGGGFNKSGIHNTLEAAVYGKPVVIGPNYRKFKEARDLVEIGAAFSISNGEGFSSIMNHLFSGEGKRMAAGNGAKEYVRQHQGATTTVVNYIQENRLLTR